MRLAVVQIVRRCPSGGRRQRFAINFSCFASDFSPHGPYLYEPAADGRKAGTETKAATTTALTRKNTLWLSSFSPCFRISPSFPFHLSCLFFFLRPLMLLRAWRSAGSALRQMIFGERRRATHSVSSVQRRRVRRPGLSDLRVRRPPLGGAWPMVCERSL